jgi:hypothetical protein
VIQVHGWAELGRLVAIRVSPWVLVATLAGWALPQPVDFVVVALLTVVVSSWLHEGGHVATFWRCAGRADSAYIRSAWGLALSVRVSDPVRFRRRVALGGPLPVAGLGLVMATGAAIASSSVLAGASAALLVHGLGTLPGSSDGNRIWNL